MQGAGGFPGDKYTDYFKWQAAQQDCGYLRGTKSPTLGPLNFAETYKMRSFSKNSGMVSIESQKDVLENELFKKTLLK